LEEKPMNAAFDPENNSILLLFPDASDEPWPLTREEAFKLQIALTQAIRAEVRHNTKEAN
jgi:hypothetical protein